MGFSWEINVVYKEGIQMAKISLRSVFRNPDSVCQKDLKMRAAADLDSQMISEFRYLSYSISIYFDLSKLQIIIYYNAFLKIWTHAALARRASAVHEEEGGAGVKGVPHGNWNTPEYTGFNYIYLLEFLATFFSDLCVKGCGQ